jgi:hypothetical protein
VLELEVGSEESRWGTDAKDRPPSMSTMSTMKW